MFVVWRKKGHCKSRAIFAEQKVNDSQKIQFHLIFKILAFYGKKFNRYQPVKTGGKSD